MVSFTDTSTDSPTSWSWSFGDGGTSTAQNPTHAYASAGAFTASIAATNVLGTSTMSRTVIVGAVVNTYTLTYTPEPTAR